MAKTLLRIKHWTEYFFRNKRKPTRNVTASGLLKLHIFMISGGGESEMVTLMAADISSAEELVKAQYPLHIVTFIGHLADPDLYKFRFSQQ